MTLEVTFTVPSNSWTGSIDVTDCNLDADLTVKDVKILYDGVEQGSGELALWSKVSQISLSYSGSVLNLGNVVRIRRSTPFTVIKTVAPLETLSSSLWNAEFSRIVRRDEELNTFGTTLDSDVGVSNVAYGSSWDGVTLQAPSKNVVYDHIQTFQPIHHMGGRLTASSTIPYVGTTTTSTTLYYLPASSNVVFLNDGARWLPYTFTSVSLDLSALALTDYLPYDVFLFNNSGTLTLELTAWTNYNTRATALTRLNGVLTKTGAPLRRYVGTISTVSNTIYQGTWLRNTAGGLLNTVFNEYNRVPIYMEYYGNVTYDTTTTYDNWTGSTALHLVLGNTTQVFLNIQTDTTIITGTTTVAYRMSEQNTSANFCRCTGVYTTTLNRTTISAFQDYTFVGAYVFLPEYWTTAPLNMSTQAFNVARVSASI